jgi:hypothetical protein
MWMTLLQHNTMYLLRVSPVRQANSSAAFQASSLVLVATGFAYAQFQPHARSQWFDQSPGGLNASFIKCLTNEVFDCREPGGR